ncbi:hypothetical protein GGS26DRAFT_440763 [Hypomontagnella submonticulosa]|nr:hypothetical protein GGS26DRAFT_440763 [Hypomontagnella submonticulosa]
MPSTNGIHLDGCSSNPHHSTSTPAEHNALRDTRLAPVTQTSTTEDFHARVLSGTSHDHVAAMRVAIAGFDTQFANTNTTNNGSTNGGSQSTQ